MADDDELVVPELATDPEDGALLVPLTPTDDPPPLAAMEEPPLVPEDPPPLATWLVAPDAECAMEEPRPLVATPDVAAPLLPLDVTSPDEDDELPLSGDLDGQARVACITKAAAATTRRC